VCVALLTGWAAVAAADDIFPPQWRDRDRSTLAGWEFSTNNHAPLPDWGHNPNGDPWFAITDCGAWLQNYEGREGVWPLSGLFRIIIPNFPEPLLDKEIRIQITWAPEPGQANPYPTLVVQSDTGTFAVGGLVNEVPLEGPWVHSTYDYVLPVNPQSEGLFMYGGVFVDELVVDTICPEPSTLALSLLGLLGLLLHRRRH
jgi:hypothetical protein